VVVRYIGSSAGTGGTVSTGTDAALGYTLHTFTTTGSGTLALNALSATFSGTISGSGSFTANPSAGGKFNFTGTNTYTGATTISSGTLQIGGAGSLGSGNYAANIANAGTFLYSSSVNQTLSGAMTGTGALVKDTSAASTLTLSGVNNYTGVTTINAGTLKINSTGKIYLTDITTNLYVNSGGVLDVYSSIWDGSLGRLRYDSPNLVINGGTMRYSGPTGGDWRSFTVGSLGATFDNPTAGVSWNFTQGSETTPISGNLKFTGAGNISMGQNLTGSGYTITKEGAGTLTLGGTNSYTGLTSVNAGTLSVISSSGLGAAAAGTVVANGATLVPVHHLAVHCATCRVPTRSRAWSPSRATPKFNPMRAISHSCQPRAMPSRAITASRLMVRALPQWADWAFLAAQSRNWAWAV
jgi:autotransporter-associated beta strand protein